jgi:hypothetical protein
VDLNETLRAAVAEPPPTSIDLDVLIKYERRRERRQRWLGGTGIAAGVAVTVGVAAVGFAGTLPGPFAGGGAPPCPVLSPDANESKKASGKPDTPTSVTPSTTKSIEPEVSKSVKPGTTNSVEPPKSGKPDMIDTQLGPKPSEACGSATRRFNRALTETLSRVAPTATLTSAADPRRAPVWFEQAGDSFLNGLTMRDGDRVNGLFISIISYAQAPTREQACGSWPDGCSFETRPDGTIVVMFTSGKNLSGMNVGGHRVQVYRPDHTLVHGTVKPWASTKDAAPEKEAVNTDSAEPVISANQLLEIALAPGFTLFP